MTGFEVTVNDVCVYIPAVFGAITSLLTMGLAYEGPPARTRLTCNAQTQRM